MDMRRHGKRSGAAGLRAGDRAPDFTLTAYDGQAMSLAAELRKGPVILSFLDGRRPGDADALLMALSACAGQIEAERGIVLAISSIARPRTGTNRDFHVLYDAGCAVAEQYGILWPATFVIDQTSRIVLSLIEAAPGGALTCANVLSALAALNLIRSTRSHMPTGNR